MTGMNDFSFIQISKAARTLLRSASWRARLVRGERPHFCMHMDFCKLFPTAKALEAHWAKKPEHRVDVEDIRKRAEELRRQRRSVELDNISFRNFL